MTLNGANIAQPLPAKRKDSPLPSATKRAFRRRLLRWYDRNGRELPWRVRQGHPDPYHTFVSEAMLQQTQAATVVPYFERFIAQFPTIKSLANAEEQEILRAWQGLGYYRRARNLHQAARTIMAELGGVIPQDVTALQNLPGIGQYTAGAIASIAYDIKAPILDGNVARVFSRVFAIEQSIDDPATRARLWGLAGQLVDGTRPGDFNQSIMDLGAMVCTAKSASCLLCPLAAMCEAHSRGMVAELPVRTSKKKPLPVTHHVLAIHRRGRFLFERRPDNGLWAGMWQMPTMECDGPDDGSGLNDWAKTRLGLSIVEKKVVHTFTHQTTHRTVRFIVYLVAWPRGRKHEASQWRSLDDLDDLPLSVPQQKAADHLRAAR